MLDRYVPGGNDRTFQYDVWICYKIQTTRDYYRFQIGLVSSGLPSPFPSSSIIIFEYY